MKNDEAKNQEPGDSHTMAVVLFGCELPSLVFHFPLSCFVGLRSSFRVFRRPSLWCLLLTPWLMQIQIYRHLAFCVHFGIYA